MSLTIPVKLTLEDLIGPGLTRIIRQNQEMTQKLERPHKLNVDTSGATSSLGGLKSLIGGVVGGLSILGAISWLKGTVDDFNSADQAAAQFDATLKSTHNAVGLTRQSLLDMSTALMGKSLFDDDAITGAQSILLTFHNIKGAIYKETVPAMLDMATKMHLSLDSAAQLVGKALDSPKEGLSALTRMGVRFTDSQQALITRFAQTGQAAKAQALMLQELKTQFGGSAEAASKAGTGGLTVLMNKFGNLRETIGGLVAGGMSQGYPFLDRLINQGQKVVDWVSSHLSGIKAAFAPLRDAFQPLVDGLSSMFTQVYGNGDAGERLTTIFNTLGGIIRFISPAIKVAATLLGEVYRFQGRVTKAVIDFVATSPRLQKFFSGLWTGAVAVFKGIAEAAGKFLGGVGDIIEGVFTGDFSKIKAGLKETLSSLADTQDVGVQAAKGFVAGYKKGFDKTDLFGVKPAALSGTNAASAFMNNRAGGAQGKAPALTAAASGGGVAGVGGKGITNIYLTVNRPFENTTITAGTPQQAAKQTAEMFRDFFLAELNDVNTLASN